MTVPGLPSSRRATVTVGTFDGMHRGHQAVLAEIVRRSRESGRASVLVTFDPHPLRVVAPERAPQLLTTPLERKLLWPLFDLDHVLVLRFDATLRAMSPATFVREILVHELHVGELVIGYDHGFGRDRKGNVETLRSLGSEHGFDVDVVGAVTAGTETVSSTKIRAAIRSGDLAAAEAGLGRRYSVYATVVAGAGRGRGLGFATANLALSSEKCLPPDGVYAVWVEIDGRRHAAMANLGPRPTFDDDRSGLEFHLLEWDGSTLLGTFVGVEFVRLLRGVRRFEGPEALVEQLKRDRGTTREVLSEAPWLA